MKRFYMGRWEERKRWAEPHDLNLCFRSRRRTGRWLFSARLFWRMSPGWWRSRIPSFLNAARHDASLSVVMVAG